MGVVMLPPSVYAAIAVALVVGLALFLALVHTTRQLVLVRREARKWRGQATISLALTDNPSLGMLIADKQGLIVGVNGAAQAMLGATATDLINKKHTTDLYSEEDLRNEISSLFRETGEPVVGAPEAARLRLESGARAVEREFTWVRADRTRFPVNVLISPLPDEKGYFDGFMLSFRDITVRKNAERLAASRQSLIEQFVLRTPASVALLDRSLNYLAASQRWINDYKLGSSQVVGTPHLDQFSAKTRHLRALFERCLLGAEERREEELISLADGTEQYISWECRPWLDANGSIGGLILFSEILTQQKIAERLLARSEERLREAQAVAHIGSWEIDVSSRKIVWSEEAYRIHEIAKGTPITIEQTIQFLVPHVRPIFETVLKEGMEQGRGWDLELEIESARGRRAWTRAIGSVELVQDKPARVRCTIQDITERKAAELELSKAREETLLQATQKAEFLANMSHELRTPLNAVIGMISLLGNTQLDWEQRDYLATVKNAADNLLDLINDVLDFSKIESGKLELEREPFSLQECIDGALDLVAAQAHEKNLELGSWLEPQIPAFLSGDLVRTRQIIVNLLNNAVKFTAQGEVFLSARMDHSFEGRPILRILVRDTGVGIRQDKLQSLFHAYSQAEVSTTRIHGGTGLGLAICRKLLDLMGGRIWVESEVGRGSRFHVEIPLVPAEKMKPELPYPVDSLRGKRVLAIDDHPSAREILQLHIESWGAMALMAGSAMEALALLKHGEPVDAVVVDHAMPIMDGIDFAKNLDDFIGRPPLILLSCLGRKGVAHESERFEAVLSKPLKPQQLRGALSRLTINDAPVTISPKPATDLPKCPARVLLVDDDPVSQSIGRAVLSKLGSSAFVATNGESALRQLKHEHFDFVLMDMHMPDLDGLETTRRIRAEVTGPDQPIIIAITASVTRENRDLCLNAGMDDFLSKPLSIKDLAAVFARWIEARSAS